MHARLQRNSDEFGQTMSENAVDYLLKHHGMIKSVVCLAGNRYTSFSSDIAAQVFTEPCGLYTGNRLVRTHLQTDVAKST